ncbi:Mis12 protein-domain-containing protein [Xylariomycetidae sp. FL0641]|nr:Mis12 protein-domain-containing protein [Xylariomycetidae sp. FL0641]
MTASGSSETQLLTEHFGYPPVSLIDDIINSVNILADRALSSVEKGLLTAPPSAIGFKASSSNSKSKRNADATDDVEQSPAERAKAEVENGTHQLETLLCASIDRNFDKFEIYVMRNLLCVTPHDVSDWMRLSHYAGLDFSSPPPDTTTTSTADNQNHHHNDSSKPTVESTTRLRRRLRESMRLNALLSAERARNEALLGELRALVGDPSSLQAVKRESTSPSSSANNNNNNHNNHNTTAATTTSPFAFLHAKGDLASATGGATPLSTTTAFALSQAQALRALSTSLQTLMPSLLPPPPPPSSSSSSSPSSSSPGDDEEGREQGQRKKSWRRERLEYVEGATRRHLEAVQGLELGAAGEVRDGEWQQQQQQQPRRLERGEAEGLERVVAMLGGGGEATRDGGKATGVGDQEAEEQQQQQQMDES